jgi:hypothetical protein
MPNKKFQVPINLVNLSSDPASGSEGDMYYNTTSDVVRVYANGAWTDIRLLTQEETQDYVAPLFVHNNHTNASVTYEDALNEIRIDVINAPSAGYTSTVKHSVKLNGSIAKGQAVYVSSSNGTNMVVSKASNASEATSSKTMGLLETGGSNNSTVNVVTEGLLAGLDTSTAGTEGDPVWLGTDGNLIYGLTNKPYAPAHLVFIGIVTRKNANNGEIFVKVQNGFELNELHTVQLESNGNIADNEVLAYDSATTLWKNQTPAEAGLASLSGATFTGAVNGTSLTLSGDLTVNGTTTTINSTTLSVDDKNIELGSVDSPTNTTADGGGITLKGTTDKTFNWVNSTSSWTSSENIDLASGKTLKINTTPVLSETSLAIGLNGTTGQITLKSAATGTSILKPTDANTGSLTFTLPSSTGTLATTGQTFYIGSTPITIAQGTGTITSLSGMTALNASTSSTTSPFTISSSIATSSATAGTISISSTATANAAVNGPTGSAISLSSTASATSLKDSTGGAISISSSASGAGDALGGNISISTTASNNATPGSLSLSSSGGFTILSSGAAGTINNFNIGATTAGTGAFTSLNATSIGATTAGTGVFTTVTATSSFSGSGANLTNIPNSATTAVEDGRIVNLGTTSTIDLFNRQLIDTTRGMTSGIVYLTGFVPAKNFTLNSVTVDVRSTGTGTLYALLCTTSSATPSVPTVVANTTGLATPATGTQTLTFSSAQSLTAGNTYAIAFYSQGGTQTLSGHSLNAASHAIMRTPPFVAGVDSTVYTTIANLPAGTTIGQNTAAGTTSMAWARLA